MISLRQKQLIPLFLIVFIDSFSYFLVIPVIFRLLTPGPFDLLPPGTSEFTRDVLFSMVIALSPLVSLLVPPIIGNFSDHYGRQKTLLLCLILSAIGFLLPIIGILQKQVGWVVLGRIIGGMGTSSQAIAQASVMDISASKEKAPVLGWIVLMMNLAMILGPFLGGILSDNTILPWFSAATPYELGVLVTLVNIVMLVFWYKETLSNNISSIVRISPKEAILGAFKSKNLRWLMVLFFLLEITWSQYYQPVSLFMSKRFNYSATEISYFTAFIGVWTSLGLTFLYKGLLRFVPSLQKVLGISMTGVALGFMICGFFPGVLAQWLGMIPAGIFGGMTYITLMALMSERVGLDKQGWVMGVTSALLGLSWMLTGMLSGFFMRISPHLPTIISGVTGLVMLGIFLVKEQRVKNTSSFAGEISS